ncbi:GGDEF domain-containing protein [Mesorhizobium marinum]|uniref:diguanylate cyclase n=1 Tax=Mesorhizobium marinum TaxID=3228790 RepID=A0ABV3QWH3_9HYPH
MNSIRDWLASWSLASVKRAALLFAIVLIGVEAMVLTYYWGDGTEQLMFELAISAVITTTVGVPVLLYVVSQHERLRQLSERLAYLSSTDQMTGLLNRQTFVERLGMEFRKPGGETSRGVVAYVDADHFKRLNDRFGHRVGDRVIQLIAQHIRAVTRSDDLCGRLGGEEFGIFLVGATLEEAGGIAERLRREVNACEIEVDVPGVSVSVSIGIAAHRPGESALDTMQAADRSLYAAKNEGRNAVVIELQRYRAA